jgi:site-specific DNA-methyltransferase (adenine-specific)
MDVIFADSPYRLSGSGVTFKSGRRAPVDKGESDRSRGCVGKDREQNVRWVKSTRP